MANTVTPATANGRSVMISAMDSDWNGAAYQTLMWIFNIVFVPGAAGDYLVIKDGSDAGPAIKLHSLDGEPRAIDLLGRRYAPVIDFSACSLTAGAYVTITYR